MEPGEEKIRPAVLDFGEELKRAREARGITLKEIADATKVSKRFLQAIEQHDFRTLPAPVFTRGFVREYARYLGLDSEDAVGRYNRLVVDQQAADEAEDHDASRNRARHGTSPSIQKKGIPTSYTRIDPNTMILIGVLVPFVALTTWFFTERRAPSNPSRVTRSQPAAIPTATTPAVGTPAPPPDSEAAPLVMEVKLLENSWITLEVDGEKVWDDEIRKGTEKVFSAERSLEFKTIGNAGGVQVTLNGVSVPRLGREGQVVKDKLFDLDYVNLRKPGSSGGERP